MNEKIVFPLADPNIKYTMMDNYLFDHIMPVVKPNAWKILCLIIRKTKGKKDVGKAMKLGGLTNE